MGRRRPGGGVGQRLGLPGGGRARRRGVAVAGTAARGGEKSGEFYDGKRAAARFFFRYELPRTGPQLDLLASLDRTTLDMQNEWF
ncbi:acyl-CoA dehydrogenase C-terminal domain-containing protein [Pseudonocardia sp. T1-2H]|uniref:acyl-CoA dehydrogenase C-terminal domain-containing protein n=1 Tax=Pseudonocardia sp. T1-2H TaxID=3128899 RepID=UPI003100F187